MLDLATTEYIIDVFKILAPCALGAFGAYIFGRYSEKNSLRRDLMTELAEIHEICARQLPNGILAIGNAFHPLPPMRIHTPVYDNNAGKIGAIGKTAGRKTISAYSKAKELDDALQSHSRLLEAYLQGKAQSAQVIRQCNHIRQLQKDTRLAITEAREKLRQSILLPLRSFLAD